MNSAAGTTAADTATANAKDAADIDKTIDNLLNAQESLQDQQTALSGPIQKVNEVMTKIKTPGTAEAKRLEEVLAEMPEAQAYTRQEERVKRAQEAADAAEAALSKGAAK